MKLSEIVYIAVFALCALCVCYSLVRITDVIVSAYRPAATSESCHCRSNRSGWVLPHGQNTGEILPAK